MEFTDAGRVLADFQGWYSQRQSVQLMFIILVAIICVVTVVTLLIWARNAPFHTWFALVGMTSVTGFVLIRQHLSIILIDS
jgi:flagellar biosynthesis/type III secretory pathway M-ring protein FliF/YscJ